MKGAIHSLLIAVVLCMGAHDAWCQFPLGNSKAVVLDMRLVPDQELLIANLGESIEVWNYDTKTFVKRWSASKIIAIDYREGKVVGASATGGIVVWDLETGTPSLEKKIANAPLTAVAWLDDGHFVVGGENQAVLKISAATGDVVSQAAHSTVITTLTRGNDHMVLAGDDRGMVTIYDAGTMVVKKSVKSHSEWIRQIVVSDSLPIFYSASDDGKLCHWDVNELKTSSCKNSGNWLLTADVVDYSNAELRITALGKRSGELVVHVASAKYSTQLGAMITRVEIIKRALPKILVAVATYGGGIQLWEGEEMSLKK